MEKKYNLRQVRDTVIVYSLYQKRSSEFYEADKRQDTYNTKKIAKEILNNILPQIKKQIPEKIQRELGIHINSLEQIFKNELSLIEKKSN